MTEVKKNVPVLRLPGFEGNWIKLEFAEIVEKSKSKYDPSNNNENFPCIELESLSQETGILLEIFESKNQKSIKNKFRQGEVLFGKLRPYLKKFLVAPFEGVCSSEIWVLRGKKISNKFLFRLIQTDKFNSAVNITSGSKMPRADWEYLSATPFLIPVSKEEQQKIADFLSAVDRKIQQLSRKKELLEQYKNGLMQQLFSQKIRFKDDDGKEFPAWEEKRLGEIGYKKSSNISANTIVENHGEYKIYGATGFLKSVDFFQEKEAFISIVKDGAGVGRTLLCDAYSSVLGTLDIIKPKKNVNLYFLYSVLNSIHFTKYIIGSTIPHIYFKDYSSEKIKVPCFKEQQKIANFLSAIDSRISQTQSQIGKTQEFKKGLLQQMFV